MHENTHIFNYPLSRQYMSQQFSPTVTCVKHIRETTEPARLERCNVGALSAELQSLIRLNEMLNTHEVVRVREVTVIRG